LCSGLELARAYDCRKILPRGPEILRDRAKKLEQCGHEGKVQPGPDLTIEPAQFGRDLVLLKSAS